MKTEEKYHKIGERPYMIPTLVAHECADGPNELSDEHLRGERRKVGPDGRGARVQNLQWKHEG